MIYENIVRQRTFPDKLHVANIPKQNATISREVAMQSSPMATFIFLG